MSPDEPAELSLRPTREPTGRLDSLDDTLAHLAALRYRLPEIDGIELARAAREEGEARSSADLSESG